MGGRHDKLAHVAETGFVARPPRAVACRADALGGAVGEHLKGRVPREERHAGETVAGQAEDPPSAHQRSGGEHLLWNGHRRESLKNGRQERPGLLPRDRLERAEHPFPEAHLFPVGVVVVGHQSTSAFRSTFGSGGFSTSPVTVTTSST